MLIGADLENVQGFCVGYFLGKAVPFGRHSVVGKFLPSRTPCCLDVYAFMMVSNRADWHLDGNGVRIPKIQILNFHINCRT